MFRFRGSFIEQPGSPFGEVQPATCQTDRERSFFKNLHAWLGVAGGFVIQLEDSEVVQALRFHRGLAIPDIGNGFGVDVRGIAGDAGEDESQGNEQNQNQEWDGAFHGKLWMKL